MFANFVFQTESDLEHVQEVHQELEIYQEEIVVDDLQVREERNEVGYFF